MAGILSTMEDVALNLNIFKDAINNRVKSLTLNGSTITPTNGVAALGTMVTSIKLNNTAQTTSAGVVSLTALTGVKANGTTATVTAGVADLGTLGGSVAPSTTAVVDPT